MAKKVKLDINSKPVKYYLNRKKGMNKTKAVLEAGYAHPEQASAIERTEQYKLAVKKFKDEFLIQGAVEEIAMELWKNIRQDNDRGAKNNAIKLALERIEPDVDNSEDGEDKIMVILAK